MTDVAVFARYMLDGYVECGFWLDRDPVDEETGDGPALEENYGTEDVAPETLAELLAELVDFLTDGGHETDRPTLDLLLSVGSSGDQAGHDFYLTRNGHGAGFWDRGYGKAGDILTERCKPYGTGSFYVGDDGRVYHE